MAVMVIIEWPGATLDQYDQVRRETNFEVDLPGGGILHLAGHDGNALRIVDLWDSAESFQTFLAERVMPAVMAAGMPGEPTVAVVPLHNRLDIAAS